MKKLNRIAFFASWFDIGNNMKGMGYRIWELANVLGEYFLVDVYLNGFDESDIVVTNSSKNVFYKLKETVKYNNWEPLNTYNALIFEDNEEIDIILKAVELNIPVVFDSLLNPMEILQMEKQILSKNPDLDYGIRLNKYKLSLFLSDLILVGSAGERQLLMGALTVLGRVNRYTFFKEKTLDDLLLKLPIGYSQNFNEKKLFQKSELSQFNNFVWNGGVWNHYEPQVLVSALDILRSNYGLNKNILFMYSNMNKPTTIASKLYSIKDANLKGLLFNTQDVYFDNRSRYMLAAEAIVCLWPNSAEGYTTLRLRSRDVWLYEKPIICSDYGLLPELVEELEIGKTCQTDHPETIAHAMWLTLTNIDVHIKNIKKHKDMYAYENTALPLISFLHNPVQSPDKNTQWFSKILDQLKCA